MRGEGHQLRSAEGAYILVYTNPEAGHPYYGSTLSWSIECLRIYKFWKGGKCRPFASGTEGSHSTYVLLCGRYV